MNRTEDFTADFIVQMISLELKIVNVQCIFSSFNSVVIKLVNMIRFFFAFFSMEISGIP